MVADKIRHLSYWRVRWFRGLFALDFAGLLLAAYVASRSVPFPKGQMLVTLTVTLGLAYWLAFQPRVLLPLYNRYLNALVCPALAAASTLLVEASLRSYYSGMYLARFTLIWTLALIVVRVVVIAVQPRARILMVQRSPFWSELNSSPRIRAFRLDAPPEDFAGWDMVTIDPTVTYDPHWLSWLTHADMRGIPIINAPRLVESVTGKTAVDVLDGRWATEVFPGTTEYRFWKRVLDLAATLILLPFLVPMSLLVAALVLFSSGRPILFWQTRVGTRGRPFRMVKFRTMRVQLGPRQSVFADPNDERITRTGAFLRRFRLDEIPQFWNVLLGQMSIIGPRPEQVELAERFERTIPLYGLRHTVKPGITGWAQIRHGYAGSADETREKLRYDMYYVKHLSFWLDLEVVLRTLLTIVTGFGSR